MLFLFNKVGFLKQYYNFQMLGIELTEKEKKIWSEMGDQLVATT